MEFKVGDKVRVLKAEDGNEDIVGKTGTIVKRLEIMAQIEFDEKLDGCWGNGYKWNVDYDKLELINDKKLTKDELLKLPTGTKITTDNNGNNVFIKICEDRFVNDDCDSLCDYDINNDLTIDDEDCGTRIIKVEVPSVLTYETKYDYSEEVREMTIAEISKALGYEVKIIKE